MNLRQFQNVFPLGSHLCREPMPPMSELKRDMENLKRHGFNLIKIQEHWQIDEPTEGQYDFSRNEELIEWAERLDLGVYLGLTCEQAPHWLWEKHPDCRMVGRNGLPVIYEAQNPVPSDGKPGPCFDHEGARSEMLKFIRKLVEVLGRFENVVVWNTWQEIAYWSENLVGQPVCYCPNTIEHWRRWLQERYGDLDGLNRVWNTRYTDWSQVIPNRLAKISTLPMELDWRYFMDNVQIAAVLRARAEVIRQADPLGRPVFAHKSASITGSGMDWTYARCQDFLGSSAYPANLSQTWDDIHPASGQPFERHAALSTEMWDLALRYDYIRSCNRPGAPVWAAEFQGGPISSGFHKGRVPSPDDIRRWMLTIAGCGVTAVSFWVTRAEILSGEANGYSLLDSQDDSTPRYEEAGRIGVALNRHADLFGRATLARAEAAILIDERNYQFCTSMSQGGGNLSYDVRGWHRLLCESGVPVDFIETSTLDEQHAESYKALILPFPLALSESTASALEKYVQAGGNLICEACPGRMDDVGFCRRGELSPQMAELFGVRHEDFTMVREPNCGKRWSATERTWGEYLDATCLEGVGPLAGQHLRANVYVETYTCRDAQPCLQYKEATAGVVRRAGEGQAWLLGTFVGHNGTAYRDQRTWDCILAILDGCGVSPQNIGRLLFRRRVLQNKEAWLLQNPTDTELTEHIDVRNWKNAEDLLDERLNRSGDTVEVTVRPLDIRVLIVSR